MAFSVLLSIYSKEDPLYFKMAMESIWNFQSLKPDEIVLVEDGPLTSELDKEILIWKDKLGDKLIIVTLDNNVGLGKALNCGLKYCSYDLVARMDTDDISFSDRFEKQILFMSDNPKIDVLSTWIDEVDAQSREYISTRKVPFSGDALVSFARLRSPVNHPSSIFRKNAVEEVGGYPLLRKAQDYGLWSLLLCNGYKIANLQESLLAMRTGREMMLRRGISYLKYEIKLLKYQRRIGFLSRYEFARNILIRSIIRSIPVFLKKTVYSLIRVIQK